jgi:3-phosphoglycerate kinase
MANLNTIKDLKVKGKRVLLRVDFNVPISATGEVADDTRIVKALPTIKSLIKQGASVVLMSHLGRPNGTRDEKLSLKPVSQHLEKVLKKKVVFTQDCVGTSVSREIQKLKSGSVAMLENLRFHAEEEKNDDAFAKELASLGDAYVNDAFGTAHRAHASTEGITKYLPSAAGQLVLKEIEYFDRILMHPKKPFVAILGGAKVTDKIKVIENLMKRVDCLVIGGAMAYTFLKARGHRIGNSKFDSDAFNIAKQILEASKKQHVQLLLPHDHVVAETVTADANTDIADVDIEDGWIGVDIGPQTRVRFTEVLRHAKTAVWNGPVGVFEIPAFSKGTQEIAICLSELKNSTTVIGGGETAQAVSSLGLEDKMSHVSTGGGASLEYLEGKALPGIEALRQKEKATTQ